MIGRTSASLVFCTQKLVKEEKDRMSGGRLFQRMDAATGNERRPTVARRCRNLQPAWWGWTQTITTGKPPLLSARPAVTYPAWGKSLYHYHFCKYKIIVLCLVTKL